MLSAEKNPTQTPLYVAVAGNIGSGKSTLTALLSQKFGWKPAFEIVDTNPYLVDFYKNMDRWSFALQMFFLTSRFKHQRQILQSQEPVIQDRTIFEDSEIFARNLYLQQKMEERDYRTYVQHYDLLLEYLRPPDLLIYLKADLPTLKSRIQKRGREYERSIADEYLESLNMRYEEWIMAYRRSPVVVVDTKKLDLLTVPKHLEQVASIVAWEIQCLKNKAQQSLPLALATPSPRSELTH